MSSERAFEIVDAAMLALARHGLIQRGGFDFDADEDAPPGPSGDPLDT